MQQQQVMINDHQLLSFLYIFIRAEQYKDLNEVEVFDGYDCPVDAQLLCCSPCIQDTKGPLEETRNSSI